VRAQRAELRRALRYRHTTATAILQETPEFAANMRLERLLLAVPGLGPSSVKWGLRQCRISPSKTVGGLSVRQRDELVKYLRGR
jgi:hypothetical protein